MRLPQLLAAAMAAVPATADSLYIYEYWLGVSSYQMGFTTDHGSWIVRSVINGCQSWPGVPGLETLCMDHSNARRGHFKFSHQNFKRCLRFSHDKWEDGGVGSSHTDYFYVETPCTWRLADEGGDEAVDVVSALPAPEVATTLETRLAVPTPA